MHITLTPQLAVGLLTLLVTARATGCLFSKICLAELEPLTLLAYRSLLASLFLLPFLYRRLMRIRFHDLKSGIVLGIFFFLTMVAELVGLVSTNVSIAAVLENTAIVMVPFIAALFSHRVPDLYTLICCTLAFAGVAVMTWTGAGFYLAVGESLLLLSAIFYALNIVFTSRLAEGCDPLAVGFVQVLTMGVLATLCAFRFESPAIPISYQTYESLFYLAIICTSFGFTLQPLAQSRCSAETAGILCALSPPVGVLLGVIVLGETLTTLHITGLFLVLVAIMLYALITNNKNRNMISPE